MSRNSRVFTTVQAGQKSSTVIYVSRNSRVFTTQIKVLKGAEDLHE